MSKKNAPSGEIYIDYSNFNSSTNAELVDQNVNNIIYLNTTVNGILEIINITDLSGYYTKQEVDNLLNSEVDITVNDDVSISSFGRANLNSPFINKINIDTSLGSGIYVFTDDIHIVGIDNNSYIDFIPKTSRSLVPRVYVDNIKTELMLEDNSLLDMINALTLRVQLLENDNISIHENIDLIEQDIEQINTINTLQDLKIDDNSQNIILLAELVESTFSESFNSIGDGTYPFLITEGIDIDFDFGFYLGEFFNITGNVVVLLEDAASFSIVIEMEINNTSSGKTFLIKRNDIIVNTITLPIIEGTYIFETTYLNAPGSVNMFTFMLEVGGGTATINTPPKYSFLFEGVNTGQVSTSSDLIIDTHNTVGLENLGINSTLNQVDKNKLDIILNKESILGVRLPIGSIIISETAPTYGLWEDLGILADGESIIGGEVDSDGNIKSHNHNWTSATGGFPSNFGAGSNFVITGFETFDVNGEAILTGDTSFGTIGSNYTDKIGSDKNYSYGKGVGTQKHVWRRVS